MGLFSRKKNERQLAPELKPARSRVSPVSRAEIEKEIHRQLEKYELQEWAKRGVKARNWDDLMCQLRQMECGRQR